MSKTESSCRCMLCLKDIDITSPFLLIHYRARRDDYMDYDFLVLCPECGDKRANLSVIKEEIARRHNETKTR